MARRLGAKCAFGMLVLVTALSAKAQTPVPKGFTGSWHAEGAKGAVAAGGEKSVEAGLNALRAGGNAADAAAATILALTVTDSSAVCFGGEVPILYYDAKTKRVEVIAGQGAAPRLATREYFASKPGGAGIPARGIEPAAVPALLDAVLTLLERHGTTTFTQAVGPTLRLLDQGEKPWHADLARTLGKLVEAEASADGDRVQGLRKVADAFYRGSIARDIDAWSRANGGLIRYVDLASHVTRVEEPVTAVYRRLTIVKCGAWTQGPALLEALQLLEGGDLKGFGRHSPATIHRTVEALKLALADRDSFYADPIFADVPVSALLSPKYAELRRPLIDPKHASLIRRPGDPIKLQAILDPAHDPVRLGKGGPSSDTTTCLTADEQGNVVAATPSGWSGVVAGSTGVWLGSRLQSFNLWEGHPNVIEPGKRPRITLTPTLVLDADRSPVLAISVAGADNQDQLTLQLLIDRIDFNIEPAESARAPRFLSDDFVGSFRQTPPAPGRLRINPAFGDETLDALKALGHRLEIRAGPLASAPVVLAIESKPKSSPTVPRYRVAGDPQAGRHVLAY